MKLIDLDRERRREVVATLEALLESAKHGKIVGLAYIAQMARDEHCAGTSGTYRRYPEKALQATFTLERHLARVGPHSA